MVRTPLPRVSHDHDDPHHHSNQDHQSHEWTSANGFDAEHSGAGQHISAPVRRHARPPRWSSHEDEQREHGPPSRHLDELSISDTHGFEDMRQERTAGVTGVHTNSVTAAATDHRYTTATPRRQYQGSSSTRIPDELRRDQYGAPAQVPVREVGSPADATESKTALGFIMNECEQPFTQYARAGTQFSFGDLDSRRRRAFPRIPARTAGCQPLYDSVGGLEEKRSAYDSTSLATYSSTQPQRLHSSAAIPASFAHFTVDIQTSTQSRRMFMKNTSPLALPSANMTPKQTGENTSRARPQVRPAPSGTSQQKRRARECKIDGCPNYIINRGLCFRHGGGKKCSEDGCSSSAKHAGKCWKHGGSLKCLVETCTRKGKTRGLCWLHGGGTKCSDASCPKAAVSNGFCWAHGGGKRCALEDCNKAAYKRTHNYCVGHYELLKDGNVTLEVQKSGAQPHDSPAHAVGRW